MESKFKKMARVGYVAKGTVYAIVGVLTFKAAFNMGGQKAGKMQVLQFLDHQTFGNVLLVLMGLGLCCYAGWRFIQSLKNPEHLGSDSKGKGKRLAFFVSGVLYLGLAIMAFLRVFGSSGGSGGTTSPQRSSFLASETGLIFLGIAGALIICVGIYQFLKAYRSDYFKKFDLYSIQEEKRRKLIKNTAEFGLSARGVIFLIIGFFAIKAALNSNPSQIKTTVEAFSFIQQSSYGPWLMGLVAAGLVAYAIYMFLKAKYRRFPGTSI